MKRIAALALFAALSPLQAALDDSVKSLVSIEREGRGNEAASAAWQEIVKAGPSALPALLAAAGKGSEVSDNWLRLAGDVIVENAAKSGQPLPVEKLVSFVTDTAHAPAGRTMAFDLLRRADAAKADDIEPKLVQDPVQALRRGAVQRLIDAAKNKTGDDQKTACLAALDAVRDEDQTAFLAGELKKLDVPVDLPRHFGFLMKWDIIGPFDNTETKGFDAAFPPESERKLDATYEGKTGPVTWQPLESKDEYGKLDFNPPFGLLKEVTAYATTTFESATERDAELRLASKNGWKVWLNGKLLFGRDEYHRGQEFDQYKLKCRLRQGANVILVKCCQDNQKETWSAEWEFKLRVCDSTGTAILSAAK